MRGREEEEEEDEEDAGIVWSSPFLAKISRFTRGLCKRRPEVPRPERRSLAAAIYRGLERRADIGLSGLK